MKTINKITTFFTLILLMFISINGATLNANQDYTGERYIQSDISLITTKTIFGNDNNNYSLNNESWVYDTRDFISYLDTEYYLTFSNQDINSTLQVHLTSIPEVGEVITTTFNIEMEQIGDYHFLIKPAYNGENLRLEVNAPAGYVGELRFTTTKNTAIEDINAITGTFVGSMKDLIDINIGFWKMLYYIFIIGVIIGSLGLLINFAFKVYDWSDRAGKHKRKLFSHAKGDK